MERELFNPPGMVRPADDLADLAGRINAEHAEAIGAARASLRHAKNAGELLLEAKRKCGHGRWLSWLKAHVKFSERTAQDYMRVARRWPELEANPRPAADLTIKEVLKALTAPEEEAEEASLPDLQRLTPILADKTEAFKKAAPRLRATLDNPEATFEELMAVRDTAETACLDIAEADLRCQRAMGQILNDIEEKQRQASDDPEPSPTPKGEMTEAEFDARLRQINEEYARRMAEAFRVRLLERLSLKKEAEGIEPSPPK